MSIQTCEDCGERVSSSAVACPHCGRPLKLAQVIEQTSKQWKGLMAIGAGISIIGAVVFLAGAIIDKRLGTLSIAGGCITISGMIWYAAASIGAWWHHG